MSTKNIKASKGFNLQSKSDKGKGPRGRGLSGTVNAASGPTKNIAAKTGFKNKQSAR
jgi:hypothetical protein